MADVLVILSGASEPVRGEDPTSLERATTPVLDALAQLGTLRRLRTTPDGASPTAAGGTAALLGAAGALADPERTVVITGAGPIASLAVRIGARLIEPAGDAGDPSAPLHPLADAALVALAGGGVDRVVIHVAAVAAAAAELDAELKVDVLEAVDDELLTPLAAAVHEIGGVLEIAIDHGRDPQDGRAHGGPTPALRWESDAAPNDNGAGDDDPPPTDPRDIDPDAPGLRSGLDPEDLPVMAVPKRRASSAAQTGRRLTERWVQPLPVEELRGH